MSNLKGNFLKSYRNIIICTLILAVLFSLGQLITNMEVLALQGNGFEKNESIENIEKNDDISRYFIKVLQHVFPNRKVQDENKIPFSMQSLYATFIAKIFQVDLKDPLTFVQAQFPVTILHHDKLVADLSQQGEEEEEDWSREIYFVDYDESNTLTADQPVNSDQSPSDLIPPDEDDLGEMEEGIYSFEEKDIVDSLNATTTDQNLENVQRPNSIQFEKDKPGILIYHTHGTESYKPAVEGNYHSLRKEYTVIAAGEIITKELEKRGFNVIHDITYHDYPSYNGSYGRSLTTVRGILEKNPSIKVIIDLHRDGYDQIDASPNKNKLIASNRVEINNELCARFQFVIGAATPNRKEVETFAHFVKAVSDNKYPGFSKEVLVKQYGKYNQFLSSNATLIELGSNVNTIEEAKNAAYYLADVLGEALSLLGK